MSRSRPRLLVATRNPGKLKELAVLLAEVPFELVSLPDVGINFEVEETGETFEENATLKASAYCEASGLLTLADDSGLEVDVLGGQPGVRSSRYAGAGAGDEERNALLIRNLRAHPRERWSAKFRCVIAIAAPSEEIELAEGSVDGVITDRPRGTNGFGYDPLFFLPDLGKTMAELAPEAKDALSHRGIAARKAVSVLNRST